MNGQPLKRRTQPHRLSEFRLPDTHFEIINLQSGETLSRRAMVAEYFYHVIQGDITIRREGYDSECAGIGDTLVVAGFQAHEVQLAGSQPAKLLYGSAPMEHFVWLRVKPALYSFRAASPHPMIKRLRTVLGLVIDELSHPDLAPDQLCLERAAELSFFYVFRMSNPVTGELNPLPWSDPRLMTALSAMNDDPVRDWSVAELAELANMSRSAFSSRFKELIGESPIKTLTSIRLNSAASRLLEGGSISAAAMDFGYNSEEAFNRAFKREFGITPGRWIRKQQA